MDIILVRENVNEINRKPKKWRLVEVINISLEEIGGG